MTVLPRGPPLPTWQPPWLAAHATRATTTPPLPTAPPRQACSCPGSVPQAAVRPDSPNRRAAAPSSTSWLAVRTCRFPTGCWVAVRTCRFPADCWVAAQSRDQGRHSARCNTGTDGRERHRAARRPFPAPHSSLSCCACSGARPRPHTSTPAAWTRQPARSSWTPEQHHTTCCSVQPGGADSEGAQPSPAGRRCGVICTRGAHWVAPSMWQQRSIVLGCLLSDAIAPRGRADHQR